MESVLFILILAAGAIIPPILSKKKQDKDNFECFK